MGETKEKIMMNMDCGMKHPEDEEESPKASDFVFFASNSTLHGLSHIVMHGRMSIQRVFWACAVLAALCGFLIEVADRLRYYFEYHYVTVLDEKEIDEMIFPAITICNYNQFRKSAITKNDLYWAGEMFGVSRENYTDYLKDLGQDDGFTNFFPSKTFNMFDFFHRTGHTMEEMLVRCQYRNRNCSFENFTTVSHNVH